METIVHPATDPDLATVAALVAEIRGAADSGQETLGRLGEPQTTFAIRPFRSGSVEGECVAAPGIRGDGMLLYLHGRRFQFDEPAGVYAARLSAAARLPVLLLRYRLAPRHPYPAALDDVVEAYQALLAQGTPPDQIVVAGHSAGATLALSALLELRDAGTPMPAAAVALSPITDFTLSGESIAGNDGKDVITLAEVRQVASAYLGSADPGGAPQSPLAGDCAGLPPLLIACGDVEMLREDAIRFASRAEAAGVGVNLELFEGMPHGFPVLPLDASQALLDSIGRFTAERLAGIRGEPAGPCRSGGLSGPATRSSPSTGPAS